MSIIKRARGLSCVAVALAALLASSTSALAWAYDEATDGELTLAKTVQLEPGYNLVVGTTAIVRFQSTGDEFNFTVPTGNRLTEMRYYAAYDGGEYYAEISYQLLGVTQKIVMPEAIPNPPELFPAGIPLSAGTYALDKIDTWTYEVASKPSYYHYNFLFKVEAIPEVSAVPEPTGLAMLCAGLLGLGALRRRVTA